MTDTIEIADLKASMTPDEAQIQATITLGSVVLLSLAAVGGYVVAKKAIANGRENWKIRREMKALYKEHKKVKSTDK